MRASVREIHEDDAPAILRIAWEQNLPRGWTWPEGRHGYVAEVGGEVVAFCALYETVYGLVTDELWESPTTAGYRGLAALRQVIERIAQGLADKRGEPLQCGGVVRLDRAAHIEALKRRRYVEEAVVLARVFTPQSVNQRTEVA